MSLVSSSRARDRSGRSGATSHRHLRPLSSLEMLDRALWLLQSRPGAAYRLTVPVTVALALVYLSFVHATSALAPTWVQAHPRAVVAVLAGATAVLLAVRYATHHMIVATFVGADLGDVGAGVAPDPARGWASIRGRVLRVLATGALRAALLVGALVALVFPAVLLWPRLFFTVPIGVYEDRFGIGGIRASARAIRGGDTTAYQLTWHVWFGLWILAADLYLSVPLALALAEGVLGIDVLFVQRLIEGEVEFLFHVIGAAVFIAIDPLLPILASVAYVDQRIRVEGLDLSLALENSLDRVASEVPAESPSSAVGPVPSS